MSTLICRIMPEKDCGNAVLGGLGSACLLTLGLGVRHTRPHTLPYHSVVFVGLFRRISHTRRDLYFCPSLLPPVFLAFDSSICGSPLFESSLSNSIAYQKEREKQLFTKFYLIFWTVVVSHPCQTNQILTNTQLFALGVLYPFSLNL